MTTIIREGDFLYSDSRYSSYYGGFRTLHDGPGKMYLAPNRKAVIGMAGAYNPDIPYDLITDMVERAIEELQKYPNSKMRIGDNVHDFYKQRREQAKDDPDFDTHDFQLLICTLKGTFIFNCFNDITVEFYHNRTVRFGIGSGSMYYPPFRDMDIPIEEKFKLIYSSDPASGGPINVFDLKELEV